MKPIKTNIIVQVVKEHVTAAGIIVPVRADDKRTATVYSVGEKSSIKPGQTVQIRPNVGVEIDYQGENYLHINEAHVIGIL